MQWCDIPDIAHRLYKVFIRRTFLERKLYEDFQTFLNRFSLQNSKKKRFFNNVVVYAYKSIVCYRCCRLTFQKKTVKQLCNNATPF